MDAAGVRGHSQLVWVSAIKCAERFDLALELKSTILGVRLTDRRSASPVSISRSFGLALWMRRHYDAGGTLAMTSISTSMPRNDDPTVVRAG